MIHQAPVERNFPGARAAMKAVVDAQIEKFKAENLDDELGTPKG